MMGHFDVDKTLGILEEYFYWPKRRSDVAKVYACFECNSAKSKILPHGLYTPIPTP